MIEQFVDANSINYRKDGLLHRPNGPAIIWSESSWVWQINGMQHRYYGPSNVFGVWCIHGEMIK
jgi:hypothetical protein